MLSPSSLAQRFTQPFPTVAFCDATDERILRAGHSLLEHEIVRPLFIGEEVSIRERWGAMGFDSELCNVHDSSTSLFRKELAEYLFEKRRTKGLTQSEADLLAGNPLYCAGFLLSKGEVSATVAGSLSTTGEVIRSAIATVGLKQSVSMVSSFFLLQKNDSIYAFADCSVIPSPDSRQLSDIGFATAQNFSLITGLQPRVAFLSFSTKGSSRHSTLEHIIEAATIFEREHPEIASDGELQFDTAIIPEIAQRKAPESPVAGMANVLIFPDLNSGNIAYKVAERLGGFTAIGPVLQGLDRPFMDLSRGCSVADIELVACLGVLLSQ